ncbi:MAG: S49 family peptidase, partial [Paracoccaceae bacterium]|nr:S49 family peptidase [Paracoccaceae bacterium]
RKGKEIDESAFTGRFWTGQKAIEIGLVDQIGHMVPVMKEKFGNNVKFNSYIKKKKFLSSLGAQITSSTLDYFKVNSLWEKFRL